MKDVSSGGVPSTLNAGVLIVVLLPATSVTTTWAVAAALVCVIVSGLGLLVDARPDRASLASKGTLTGAARQPASSGSDETAPKVTVGGVWSFLMVTALVVLPAALVARQLYVMPAVSAFTIASRHPPLV